MTVGIEALATALVGWLDRHPEIIVSAQEVCRAARESGLEFHQAADESELAVLALGFAAATGSTSAIQAFEARYFGRAKAALAKMDASAELRADALGQAMEVLFVGRDGAPPRILALLGKGDVQALVKVVAVRRLLNLQRARRARPDGAGHDDEDALAMAIAREPGPELQAMALERVGLLKSSLGAALASLVPDSRTLLRLSLVHGLSIDDLAGMYGIHRSTAARRLVSIREQLRLDVRRQLAERIEGSTTDVESVLRVADSKLDLSFERLLSV